MLNRGNRRLLSSAVLYEKDCDRFGFLTLNRPEVHNAFNAQMIAQLSETALQAEKDGLRCLFIRSNGKNFSAGGDLSYMKELGERSLDDNVADANKLGLMLRHLNGLSCPTVAFVQGAVRGGGVGLVSVCDVVFAAASASFALSEVSLGLIPATISPYVMEKMGVSQARRFFLTGEVFRCTQAREVGLVHEVVDDFAEREADLKSTFLRNSPAAVAASKQLIRAVVRQDPASEAVLKDTAVRLALQRSSHDGKEGVAAFIEKRKPQWGSLDSV